MARTTRKIVAQEKIGIKEVFPRMRSQNLKRHHGAFIEFKFSVKTANKIAIFRENSRCAEKSDVVVCTKITFDANDAEKCVFINKIFNSATASGIR